MVDLGLALRRGVASSKGMVSFVVVVRRRMNVELVVERLGGITRNHSGGG